MFSQNKLCVGFKKMSLIKQQQHQLFLVWLVIVSWIGLLQEGHRKWVIFIWGVAVVVVLVFVVVVVGG